MSAEIATVTKVENYNESISESEYGDILKSFSLQYKQIEYYLQVGEIIRTQGWILHLSVILSQISDLLQVVVPYLARAKASFKIIINKSAAEDLLHGNLGLAQIGKIVSIYPENDNAAQELAKSLISLTERFRGPAIPTDFRLANIVYTRFGSFNPIIKQDLSGGKTKYIYDRDGHLVIDNYAIPFQFPSGIEWPFKALSDPVLPSPPKMFNRIYKVLEVLKTDPRGNVYKGLYLKNLFQIKNCVFKQGFSYSASDSVGRDIRDRLIWQLKLYKELSPFMPLPVIYDLIEEGDFVLLVMECIDGCSLYHKVHKINPFSKSWHDLTQDQALQLISLAIELISIIEKMHKLGYVHRDITPVNFIINKSNQIVLIDIELAYSINNSEPNPAFTLGTPGFMSPEQEDKQEPSISQDVYSLGATLLYLFTGLTPTRFDVKHTKHLFRNLYFFIGNLEITSTIANCLHQNPNSRPCVYTISRSLMQYRDHLNSTQKPITIRPALKTSDIQIKDTILSALRGLTNLPLISINDLWYSQKITKENFTAPRIKQYTKYPGIAEGVCGPLYLLAKLNKLGVDVTEFKASFIKGWKWIEQDYFKNLGELSPGLYRGAAGVALALSTGVQCGLLENSKSNSEKILYCLRLPNERLDLANGIAGQGVSVLQCGNLLHPEILDQLLTDIVTTLLHNQQKNGLWLDSEIGKSKKHKTVFDLGYDNSGIIWFLLEYINRYPNKDVQNAIKKAFDTMLNNKRFLETFYDLCASRAGFHLGDGGNGMILILLKAFETFEDDFYKQIAETALYKHPSFAVNPNFTQQSGLAGIGEIYLEAWRVLNNEEWNSRALWLADVYLHTFFKNENNTGFWQTDENNPPTADLLTGISGIIHFIARILDPLYFGYRILK